MQVRIASNRPAIRVADMAKFVDVSEIQVYRINGFDILHLNPNVERAAINGPCCITCRRKLMKPGYKFCSIACKVRFLISSPPLFLMYLFKLGFYVFCLLSSSSAIFGFHLIDNYKIRVSNRLNQELIHVFFLLYLGICEMCVSTAFVWLGFAY